MNVTLPRPTALYSVEGLMSDFVNNFTELGPGSLDLSVDDEAPVALARMIFNHYVGDVRVDKEVADNVCEVSFSSFSVLWSSTGC